MTTWRDFFRPIIAQALLRAGSDPKAIRRERRTSWCCGERRHWPYKVWLDEWQRQMLHPGGLSRRLDPYTRDLFEDERAG